MYHYGRNHYRRRGYVPRRRYAYRKPSYPMKKKWYRKKYNPYRGRKGLFKINKFGKNATDTNVFKYVVDHELKIPTGGSNSLQTGWLNPVHTVGLKSVGLSAYHKARLAATLGQYSHYRIARCSFSISPIGNGSLALPPTDPSGNGSVMVDGTRDNYWHTIQSNKVSDTKPIVQLLEMLGNNSYKRHKVQAEGAGQKNIVVTWKPQKKEEFEYELVPLFTDAALGAAKVWSLIKFLMYHVATTKQAQSTIPACFTIRQTMWVQARNMIARATNPADYGIPDDEIYDPSTVLQTTNNSVNGVDNHGTMDPVVPP